MNKPQQSNNGYDSLLLKFTNALESNTDEIAAALQELTKKELTEVDKRQLRSITKQLKKVDGSLKNIK